MFWYLPLSSCYCRVDTIDLLRFFLDISILTDGISSWCLSFHAFLLLGFLFCCFIDLPFYYFTIFLHCNNWGNSLVFLITFNVKMCCSRWSCSLSCLMALDSEGINVFKKLMASTFTCYLFILLVWLIWGTLMKKV